VDIPVNKFEVLKRDRNWDDFQIKLIIHLISQKTSDLENEELLDILESVFDNIPTFKDIEFFRNEMKIIEVFLKFNIATL
jgi:hypothetical protein